MRYIVTIDYEGAHPPRQRPLLAADLKQHIEDRYLDPVTVEPVEPGSALALAIEAAAFAPIAQREGEGGGSE